MASPKMTFPKLVKFASKQPHIRNVEYTLKDSDNSKHSSVSSFVFLQFDKDEQEWVRMGLAWNDDSKCDEYAIGFLLSHIVATYNKQ